MASIYYFKSHDDKRLGLSTQQKSEYTPPSMIFVSNDKPLNQADNITVIVSSGRKVKKYLLDVFKHPIRDMNPVMQLVMAIKSPVAETSIETFKHYPEFFKFVDLNGANNIYHYLTTNLKIPVELYNKYFIKQSDENKENSSNYFRFHNADVFFPDNMRDSRKTACLQFLQNIYILFAKHGLTKLFFGEIRFVPLSVKFIGTYSISTKDLKIQPNVKDSYTTEYTIIHELGHKYFHEFMTPNERKMIDDKFDELRKNGKRLLASADFEKRIKNHINNKISNFEVGTVIIYNGKKRNFKNTRYRIISISSTEIVAVDENGKKIFGPPNAFANFSIENDVPDEMPNSLKNESTSWFPTEYSMSKPEEWWCENFAFYMLDKIKNKEVKDWFGNLIK